MTIETGLRTHLLADGPLAALVVARVYPLKLPQSPIYPALTYEIISDIPHRGLAGDSDRERIRARIHCWAATYTGAVDLAGKVRTAVADFSGLMGTTKVSSVKFESWNDIFEDVPEVYRRIADFFIAHT
jgi:hypothetical protein